MACSINGCRNNRRANENVAFYPFPNDPTMRDQWAYLTGKKCMQIYQRPRACSRHFFAPPRPTDVPALYLPPPFERRSKYPEQVVLRQRVPEASMAALAKDLLLYPHLLNSSDVMAYKVSTSGVTYTKLWLLKQWRKLVRPHVWSKAGVANARRRPPACGLALADDMLHLLDYIMHKDHLSQYWDLLDEISASVPNGKCAELAEKYGVFQLRVQTAWDLFSSGVLMKLQWLTCVGDRWDKLPRAALLSPAEWANSGTVIMGLEHVEWAVVYTEHLGRSIELLILLAARYDLEDRAAASDLCRRRWAAAYRTYNTSGLRCPFVLLQRRWHQLKMDARRAIARPDMYHPHTYHWELLARWPHIATEPLPTWKELREQGFVYELTEDQLGMLKNVEAVNVLIDEDFRSIMTMTNTVIRWPQIRTGELEADIQLNMNSTNPTIQISAVIQDLKELNSQLKDVSKQHLYSLNILDRETRTTIDFTPPEQGPISLEKAKTSDDMDTIENLQSLDPSKVKTTIVFESDEETISATEVEERTEPNRQKDDFLNIEVRYPNDNDTIQNDTGIMITNIRSELSVDEGQDISMSKNSVVVKKEKDSDIDVSLLKSRKRIMFEDSSDSSGSDADSECSNDDEVDEKLVMDTKVILERIDSEKNLLIFNSHKTPTEQTKPVEEPNSQSIAIQSFKTKIISDVLSEPLAEKPLEPTESVKSIFEPESMDIGTNEDITVPQTLTSPIQIPLAEKSLELTEPVKSTLEPDPMDIGTKEDITEPQTLTSSIQIPLAEKSLEPTEPVKSTLKPVPMDIGTNENITEPVQSLTSPIQSLTSPIPLAEKSLEPTEPVKSTLKPDPMDIGTDEAITEPVQSLTSPIQSLTSPKPLAEKSLEPTEPVKSILKPDPMDIGTNEAITEPIRTVTSPIRIDSDSDSDLEIFIIGTSDLRPKILNELETADSQISRESKNAETFELGNIPSEKNHPPPECNELPSEDEPLIYKSKQRISENQQIPSENQLISSENQQISSEKNLPLPKSNELSSEDEPLIYKSKRRTSENQQIQSENQQFPFENQEHLLERKRLPSESDQLQSENELPSETSTSPSESGHCPGAMSGVSGTAEELLKLCRPLSIVLHKLTPQEYAKTWAHAQSRPVTLPTRGLARLLPVAQVRPIRPAPGDNADNNTSKGVWSVKELHDLMEKDMRVRAAGWVCCGARVALDLKLCGKRKPAAYHRHVHKQGRCECCCGWLLRDSAPHPTALLHARRQLTAALSAVAKKPEDDIVGKYPLFNAATFASSGDESDVELVEKAKKKNKVPNSKKRKRKKKTKDVTLESKEDRVTSGDADYDEWLRQKNQIKKYFFIKSMIGKSKSKKKATVETEAVPTTLPNNVPATLTQPTTSQSNITTAPSYVRIAPAVNKPVPDPLRIIADMIEREYRDGEQSKKLEDVLKVCRQPTGNTPQDPGNTVAPLTVENLAFHTQMQSLNAAGPSNAKPKPKISSIEQDLGNTVAPLTVENLAFHAQMQSLNAAGPSNAKLNPKISSIEMKQLNLYKQNIQPRPLVLGPGPMEINPQNKDIPKTVNIQNNAIPNTINIQNNAIPSTSQNFAPNIPISTRIDTVASQDQPVFNIPQDFSRYPSTYSLLKTNNPALKANTHLAQAVTMPPLVTVQKTQGKIRGGKQYYILKTSHGHLQPINKNSGPDDRNMPLVLQNYNVDRHTNVPAQIYLENQVSPSTSESNKVAEVNTHLAQAVTMPPHVTLQTSQANIQGGKQFYVLKTSHGNFQPNNKNRDPNDRNMPLVLQNYNTDRQAIVPAQINLENQVSPSTSESNTFAVKRISSTLNQQQRIVNTVNQRLRFANTVNEQQHITSSVSPQQHNTGSVNPQQYVANTVNQQQHITNKINQQYVCSKDRNRKSIYITSDSKGTISKRIEIKGIASKDKDLYLQIPTTSGNQTQPLIIKVNRSNLNSFKAQTYCSGKSQENNNSDVPQNTNLISADNNEMNININQYKLKQHVVQKLTHNNQNVTESATTDKSSDINEPIATSDHDSNRNESIQALADLVDARNKLTQILKNLTCGDNFVNAESNPNTSEPNPEFSENSEVDDGRDSPDVVMLSPEKPEVVDLTEDDELTKDLESTEIKDKCENDTVPPSMPVLESGEMVHSGLQSGGRISGSYGELVLQRKHSFSGGSVVSSLFQHRLKPLKKNQ